MLLQQVADFLEQHFLARWRGGWRWSRLLLAAQPVDALDENKNRARDDGKVDDRVDEDAQVERDRAGAGAGCRQRDVGAGAAGCRGGQAVAAVVVAFAAGPA